MIELNLTVCTYVPLFKGGKLLQHCLSHGLSVCVLCLFSINMNSPTQSLSHIHRAPWERADLREAQAGVGGDLDRAERSWAELSGVVVEPMGMALSLSGNHFVRHTTLILLVSLLPSVLEEQAGAVGWGGVGVVAGCCWGGGAPLQGQYHQHSCLKIGHAVQH